MYNICIIKIAPLTSKIIDCALITKICSGCHVENKLSNCKNNI